MTTMCRGVGPGARCRIAARTAVVGAVEVRGDELVEPVAVVVLAVLAADPGGSDERVDRAERLRRLRHRLVDLLGGHGCRAPRSGCGSGASRRARRARFRSSPSKVTVAPSRRAAGRSRCRCRCRHPSRRRVCRTSFSISSQFAWFSSPAALDPGAPREHRLPMRRARDASRTKLSPEGRTRKRKVRR